MEGQHGDEEARARYEQTYGIHVQSKPNDRKKQHCDDPTVQDAKKDMHSAGSRTSGGASRSQGGREDLENYEVSRFVPNTGLNPT